MKSTLSSLLLGLVATTPAWANLVLVSETRSVTASYYGAGIETHSSDGTFGVFDASAVGTPFGGGSVYVRQRSNITAADVTIDQWTNDFYGPGGVADSYFELHFALLEATQITISGYCNYYSGTVSLTSASLGAIPLIWHGGPNDPYNYYRNYLDFDQVLGPGAYTLRSSQSVGDSIWTHIAVNATSVPDGGSSAFLVAIGALALAAAHRRRQVGQADGRRGSATTSRWRRAGPEA